MKRKLITKGLLSVSPLIGILPLAVSCSTSEINSNPSDFLPAELSKAQKQALKTQWDNEISIVIKSANAGFEGKIQTEFLNKLNQRFKQFKNEYSFTKDLPDVTFKIQTGVAKETNWQNIKNDNKNNDIGIIQIDRVLADFKKNETADEIIENLGAKLVAQTETLKFTWQLGNNDDYVDGTSNDPLIKAATKYNELAFREHGEFPSWTADTSTPAGKKLGWDGSKFAVFYKRVNEPDNLFVGYRGAIYISGDKATRDKIQKAWNDKDLDAFLSFGILREGTNSNAGFKLPAKLIQKHFNKSFAEVVEILVKNKNVLEVDSPGADLGKEKGNKIYHIAFAYEGDTNWLLPEWNFYTPKNYDQKQANNFESQTNDVVRVLSFTGASYYDTLFARPTLHDIQIALIAKALDSFSVAENTFGIYTGFNKIRPIAYSEFKTFIENRKLLG
ncbi:ABC transporter thiamine pyrophosphate-binding lipoprotein p37/Cypl [Mycoplasmopsis columbinasalis]|uniref:High affinity transport system protein p37 n=1 Tax=Mycoplasmopsis columbinasalis TaxID=114880 RepID=A0A449B9P3_9BACT|nr:hypothetical protein [Mycoplasmopsis columbinasalis]VEU77886.1 High affinity transport system protein p37 precursor [Mycoplasmopsis columbinasalis]